MENCQYKKGIFVQRSCHQITDQKCSSCGIFVCKYHSEMHQGSLLCHNCYLDKEKLDSNSAQDRYMEHESGYYLWYASTRKHYYDSYGDSTPFDESDYDGFDVPLTEEGEYYDSEDDFFDS